MCRRLEVHPARESPKLAHRPGASQVSPHDDDEYGMMMMMMRRRRRTTTTNMRRKMVGSLSMIINELDMLCRDILCIATRALYVRMRHFRFFQSAQRYTEVTQNFNVRHFLGKIFVLSHILSYFYGFP